MIELTILVPLTANDGAVFSASHHAAFEAHLITAFGGFTLLPETATGGWNDEGVTYRDTTALYVVFVTGIVADSVAIRAAVDFAKVHYGQLALTVRYLGQAEIL